MGIFETKSVIGPDTVIQRKKDLLFNEIDGEVVMLSIENGEYYGINTVGSRIWGLIENPIPFKALVSQLLMEYFVSEEKCEKEALTFVYRLQEKKLLISTKF